MSGCENVNLKKCDTVDLADPKGDFIHNQYWDFHTYRTGSFPSGSGIPDNRDRSLILGSGDPKTRYRFKHKKGLKTL